MTDRLPAALTSTVRLNEAATAAGLVHPHAVECAHGWADIGVRPTSLGEWRQWCDLVAVDPDATRSPNDNFSYGYGTYDDTRITLYGHGVPALEQGAGAPTGRGDSPAQGAAGSAE